MKTFFQNTKLTYKNLSYTLLMMTVTSLIVLVIMYTFYNTKYESVLNNQYSQLKVSVDMTETFIDEKLKLAIGELKVLSEMDPIITFVNAPSNDIARKNVEQLFIKYATAFEAIHQVRIIDKDGNEVIRINSNNNGTTLVKESELQNKSNRYYFKDAMLLSEGETYISDIDLNVENNAIVYPLEPTIRLAVKLYNNSEDVYGILILNYDITSFFDLATNIDKTSLSDVGILDNNSYWSLRQLNEENLLSTKETEFNNLKRNFNLLETNYQNGYFDERETKYFYKALIFHQSSGQVSQNSPWYILGSFNIDNVINQSEFFLNNIIWVTFILLLLSNAVTYFLMVLYQVKINSQLIILTSAYISDNSHDGILILNHNKRIEYCNSVFEEIYGIKKSIIINKRISTVFKNEYDNKIHFSDNFTWEGNVWNETHYGGLICKHLKIISIKDKNKNIVYYIGIYSNPIELAETVDLSSNSDYQGIGLSNSEIAILTKRTNLIYHDLDAYAILTIQITGALRKVFETDQKIQGNFITNISEKFSLYKTSRCKFIAVPKSDLMIVLYSNENKHELIEAIQNRELVYEIESKFRMTQVELGLESFDLKFHIGIAINQVHGNSPEELLKKSLIALEALLKHKKSNYLVYEEAHYDYVKEDLLIRENLKTAFNDHEFYVQYQPQYKLENEEIVGVEALVRWKSSNLGIIMPNRFLPIMEETKSILKLGFTVLDLICEDILAFPEIFNNIRVSMNLSSKEFVDSVTIDYIISKISIFILNNVKLCIEITETTLVENLSEANKIINKLHQNEIEVAIDDFGTGYSSLSYLKELLADELKVDRIFIKDYPQYDDGKILKAIIKMAKEIDMKVIVEGVETKEQRDLITDNYCDMYQGYYGSKPLLLNDFKELMSNNKNGGNN